VTMAEEMKVDDDFTEYQQAHLVHKLIEQHQEKLELLKTHFAGREDDEVLILRFLLGLGGDVEAVKTRLESNLKWRLENNYDEIVAKFLKPGMSQVDLPFGKKVNRWWPHRYNLMILCL